MAPIAVLAQALAVVGDEDDEGLAREVARFEAAEQAADLFVDEGDLGVVAVLAGHGALGRDAQARSVLLP
ncbi:MAG: hypothetical protein AAF368_20265 [Planctomycetota bacterium]